MSEGENKLEVTLPQGNAEAIEEEGYSVYQLAQDLYLLGVRHSDKKSPYRQQRPALIASLRMISIASLLALIDSERKNGVLLFLTGKIRKTLYFQDGELVFALSNINDERLGESLIRAGKITQEQLDEAAKEISAKRKLGKILIDRGLISAKGLFQGVRVQFTEILSSLFKYKDGLLLFYEGNIDIDNPVQISKPIKQVILENRQRMICQLMLDEAIRPEDSIFAPNGSPEKAAELGEEAARVFQALDGRATAGELAQDLGLGGLDFFRLLQRLANHDLIKTADLGRAFAVLKKELDRPREPEKEAEPPPVAVPEKAPPPARKIEEPPVEPPAKTEETKLADWEMLGQAKSDPSQDKARREAKVESISRKRDEFLREKVKGFDKALKHIFRALTQHVPEAEVLASFNSFFTDMSMQYEKVLDGVCILYHGGVDIDLILANTEQIEPKTRISNVVDALNELLYFELFELKNVLGREESDQVIQAVKGMNL